MRRLLIALASLALAACGGGSGLILVPTGQPPAPATPAPPPQAAPAPSQPVTGMRRPQIQSVAGLEQVIGASAQTVIARLGTPRLDLGEGDARKLQYASASCVLDVFLYPLEAGQAPVATHVAARKRIGGGAFDPSQCLREVSRNR